MDEKVECITIEYSEDSMFGPHSESRERVDIPASFAKWEKMLIAELTSDYPSAEITVKNSINDFHSVNGRRDSNKAAWVGETVRQIWESWNWIEYLSS